MRILMWCRTTARMQSPRSRSMPGTRFSRLVVIPRDFGHVSSTWQFTLMVQAAGYFCAAQFYVQHRLSKDVITLLTQAYLSTKGVLAYIQLRGECAKTTRSAFRFAQSQNRF